jgi:hypothetical protein
MDRRKAERVAYHDGIWDFQCFSQSKTQKLSFVQPLFYPEAEFSNEVELRNAVTSKPFSEQSHISNA